jgi:hypothetical protein
MPNATRMDGWNTFQKKLWWRSHIDRQPMEVALLFEKKARPGTLLWFHLKSWFYHNQSINQSINQSTGN